MAVPDTTTFTLQNVVDEISPTYNTLQSCFDDHIPAYVNTTYWASYFASAGNLDNLLMFRDYGVHNSASLTSFGISATGGIDDTAGCALSPVDTAYHDGVGALPAIGDFVYDDAAGTTPFNGLLRWWKVDSGFVIEIDTNGEVTDKLLC